jgi:aminopeptidase-like protein
MANNEISGITVSTFIAKYLAKRKNLRHSYRFVFLPETIGSITYIHHNLKKMKKNIIAGFNLTCIGDERNYSYLPSRNGDVLSDRAALHVLENQYQGYKKYSWLDRGSDERQYCAPGIDLPIASLMRTKYGEYPEYHTSLDDLFNVLKDWNTKSDAKSDTHKTLNQLFTEIPVLFIKVAIRIANISNKTLNLFFFKIAS